MANDYLWDGLWSIALSGGISFWSMPSFYRWLILNLESWIWTWWKWIQTTQTRKTLIQLIKPWGWHDCHCPLFWSILWVRLFQRVRIFTVQYVYQKRGESPGRPLSTFFKGFSMAWSTYIGSFWVRQRVIGFGHPHAQLAIVLTGFPDGTIVLPPAKTRIQWVYVSIVNPWGCDCLLLSWIVLNNRFYFPFIIPCYCTIIYRPVILCRFVRYPLCPLSLAITNLTTVSAILLLFFVISQIYLNSTMILPLLHIVIIIIIIMPLGLQTIMPNFQSFLSDMVTP